MFRKARKPPLPAATESDLGDGATVQADDLDTEATEAEATTKYSIPESGQPIRIPTNKGKAGSVGAQSSQASLLIDLFETRSKETGRPSVRVKVSSGGKPVKVAEFAKIKQAPPKRRVSIEDKGKRYSWEGVEATNGNSSISERGPIEVESTSNNIHSMAREESPARMVLNPSEVSSMPGDSTLGGPLQFTVPTHKRDKSIGEPEVRARRRSSTSEKSPGISRRRSRSLSRDRRERLERKAAAKARAIEGSPEAVPGPRKLQKSRDKSNSSVKQDTERRSKSRRSSDSHSQPSALTESSVRSREVDSNVSSSVNASHLSKSSLANNPRLLQTVEDAIRRMILPEIDEIKRKQSVHDNKKRFSYETNTTEDHDRRRDSEIVADTAEIKSKKTRRSSRDVPSDERTSRRASQGSSRGTDERRHRHRSSRHSSRESEGLTTANLKDLNKLERERERHEERRERRKKRSQSKSDSRTDSIAKTDEEYYEKHGIPPMPMQSTNDSEFTRESIMSAETNESYTEGSSSSRKAGTPIENVKRSSLQTTTSRDSNTIKTTTSGSREATPTKRDVASPLAARSDRSLKSAQSDKSIKARHAALVAAGLGGAGGALYGHKREASERSRSRQSERVVEHERDISPLESEASVRRSARLADDQEDGLERVVTDKTTTSNHSHQSVPSTVLNGTGRVNPKGYRSVSVEQDTEGSDHDELIQEAREIASEAPHGNQVVPRVPFENDSKRISGLSIFNRLSTAASLDSPASGSGYQEQRVKSIIGNAQVLMNPVQTQSETGSLLQPSLVSINPSQVSGDARANDTPDRLVDATSYRARELASAPDGGRGVMMNEEDNASQERWKFLKQTAQALSGSKEQLRPVGPVGAREAPVSPGGAQMGANAIPDTSDPMPEIGYYDEDDHYSNPNFREKTSPSTRELPDRAEAEERGNWPYEPTPDMNKDSKAQPAGQYGYEDKFAMNDPGLGLGASMLATQAPSQDQQREPSERSTSSASINVAYPSYYREIDDAETFSPGNLKDEGYISAAPQPRSPEALGPGSRSKAPRAAFGAKANTFDPAGLDANKRSRYASGNSAGMSTDYYDASTGNGINGIQSADIVALMNHLSARDGQRSAKDSELIYTLIQTATETRQNFDQVKKMMEVQNNSNLEKQDKNAERLMNRLIMGGPRPQVLGSPRAPTTASTDEVPAKKQNIFKRALKGLGSKSSNDVSRIEDMLKQLLEEVEVLKASQAGSVQEAPSFSGPVRASTDTEQLRLQQPQDPGYEPEGQAGTGSTPSHSGYFSPATRRSMPQTNPQHRTSYVPGTRISTNRVSTVFEEDGEFVDESRPLTPVQESAHQRNVSFSTPPPTGPTLQDNDNSPSTTRGSRTIRNGSFPRISRWSRTTEGSGTDKRYSTETAGQGGRPYSQALSEDSQSGEALSVLPGADGQPWQMAEEDRLPSANSFDHDKEGGLRTSMLPEEDGIDRSIHPDLPEVSPREPKYNSIFHANLPLQHPQPLQGPTHRHQNHLETQAYDYDHDDDRSEVSGLDPQVFGSEPALSRLPPAGLTGRRISGNTNSARNSTQTQHGMVSPPDSAPSQHDPSSLSEAVRITYQQLTAGRPTQIQQAPPAIPPKIALNASQSRGGELPPTPTYSRDATVTSPAQTSSTQHSHTRTHSSLSSTTHSSEADSLSYADSQSLGPGSPDQYQLDRPRSPYIPGGPLAPIPERYSMEADRASIVTRGSSLRSGGRLSVSSAGGDGGAVPVEYSSEYMRGKLGQVVEGDESETPYLDADGFEGTRAMTPSRSPRPAVGADARGGEVRKLTGPRDMPGAMPGSFSSSISSSGSVGSSGGLKGTVRRKPVAAGV